MLIETIYDNYNLLPALPLHKCSLSLWWSRAEQEEIDKNEEEEGGVDA